MERRLSREKKSIGIEAYRAELRKGTPEIVELEGSRYLRIYRGINVPRQDTYSDGDQVTRPKGVISVREPGTDWSPYYSFAHGDYTSADNWCVLSALAPIDNIKITKATLDHNEGLDDTFWGEYKLRRINDITEGLVVEVPPECYQDLLEVRIHEKSPNFSATIID